MVYVNSVTRNVFRKKNLQQKKPENAGYVGQKNQI